VEAIARCSRHRPPLCQCSTNAEMLWSVQNRYGDRSPESYAAVEVWEAPEDIELSSRRGACS